MSTRSGSGTRKDGGKAAYHLALLRGALILALIAVGSEGSVAGAVAPPSSSGPAVASARDASQAEGRTFTVPVLMYHRITCAPSDARFPGLWVCPQVFDRTMRLLRDDGWDTITSAQLADARAAGRSLPRRTFVVVFDDGNRDGYDAAYPILERYGFEGVFAVVVGRVDVRKKAMTWTELSELQEAGHEIANHSMHHANVASLGATGLALEVGRSAERLRQHLGAWPRTFVYPFGRWDHDGIEAVRAWHHGIAFTTVSGATRRTTYRFTEPRIRIGRSDSPAEVLARVSAYD